MSPAPLKSAGAAGSSGRKGTPPAPHETLGVLEAPPASAPKRPVRRPSAKPPPAGPGGPATLPKTAADAAPKPEKQRSERTKALNFTVTGNFRKAFKLAAEAQNLKKVELLELIFAEWQNRHML